MKLQIQTPRWLLPLLKPKRFKGAKGGRSGGKSHEFGGMLIEDHISNPNLQSVCVREVQKSIKFSVKKLLEEKIAFYNVSHLFDITEYEISDKRGTGIIIFQGLQDHTADSIKSLEGFDRCWIEEAQSISQSSLDKLVPTIRKKGSEIWATWNPEQENNAIEQLFRDYADNAVLVHVNYTDNPHCPDESKDLAEALKKKDYEKYQHIWLGGYNTISDALIFKGYYSSQDFTPDNSWNGPYQGVDFGFSQDPTTAVQLYIHDNNLYFWREFGQVGLELDKTAQAILSAIPDFDQYVTRADNARPESISYLRRKKRDDEPYLKRIRACEKGKGSVEDGIEFMKSFDHIYIHPSCKETLNEFSNYKYKVDKYTGDIMPVIVDDFNHYIDAARYALEPAMKRWRR